MIVCSCFVCVYVCFCLSAGGGEGAIQAELRTGVSDAVCGSPMLPPILQGHFVAGTCFRSWQEGVTMVLDALLWEPVLCQQNVLIFLRYNALLFLGGVFFYDGVVPSPKCGGGIRALEF